MNAVQGTYNRHDMYFHNSSLLTLFKTKDMLTLRNFHEEYVFHHPIEDYIKIYVEVLYIQLSQLSYQDKSIIK